jgi:hypothetical protein
LLRGEGDEASVLHAYRDAAAKERINVINFDWHEHVRHLVHLLNSSDLDCQIKSYGQHAAVQRLWSIVGPLLRDHGMNAGAGTSTTVNQHHHHQKHQQRSPPFSPTKSPARDRRLSTSSAVFVRSQCDEAPSSPPLSPSASFKELEQGSLFSSPAFGSFASPHLLDKKGPTRRFSLSDSESDHFDLEDEVKWAENSDSAPSSSACGDQIPSSHDHCESDSSDEQTQHQQQKLLLRLSCADSLDRTNLASFFIALQFTGTRFSLYFGTFF